MMRVGLRVGMAGFGVGDPRVMRVVRLASVLGVFPLMMRSTPSGKQRALMLSAGECLAQPATVDDASAPSPCAHVEVDQHVEA